MITMLMLDEIDRLKPHDGPSKIFADQSEHQ